MKNILIIIFLLISFKVYAKCEKALDSGKIVGAGGSITETIFFLGLEKNLVARDLTSNFPDQASSLPSIGYLRNLSVEGLLSLSPTLILSEPDIGPEKVVEQIKKTSVEMRILADDYSSSGIIDKVNCIGKILGAEKPYIQKKTSPLKQLKEKLEADARSNSSPKKIMIILMFRGTSPIVAGANTSGDAFIRMTKNINIFSNIDGWKPVGIEGILSMDPDYIIVTKRAFSPFKNLESFLVQSGLQSTSAGKYGRVLVEDGMAMLGFGPRTLETGLKVIELVNLNP
tara:strand:- start:142 stop:996 length:855 start_codon:yes stop_codon:yes gene_type:complete